MDEISAALGAGLVLGLTAGLSPGPLMTLVLAQTLRHGARDGLLVAAAPLLTDVPIILLALLLLSRLADSAMLLAGIGLIGGLYILYLAYRTYHSGPLTMLDRDSSPGSLLQGVLVNALSPHPYLFWATVGAPIVFRAGAVDPAAPWLFLGGFYLLLVGSKIGIALLVGRYRTRLAAGVYPYLMRLLAAALLIFALLLIHDALMTLDLLT